MSFLSRWQLRKAEVAREEEEAKAPEQPTVDPVDTTTEAEEADVKKADAPEVEAASAAEGEEAALPDPESIEQGGSFADYLKPGVDPTQRKDALRALWKQPQYNIRDGLCEYDLDYAAQPKLSAAVAAELAKKVFRHVTEAAEEADKVVAGQPESQGEASLEQAVDEPQLAQAESAETPSELPTVREDIGQNDPHDPENRAGSRSEA